MLAATKNVRSDPEEAAAMLGYARSVAVVPAMVAGSSAGTAFCARVGRSA